jgi:hypothetical protein
LTRYVKAVSAQEIIEQIKALPPKDKAAVLEFTRTLQEPGIQYIDEKTLERVATKVFDEHEELFRKLAQ